MERCVVVINAKSVRVRRSIQPALLNCTYRHRYPNAVPRSPTLPCLGGGRFAGYDKFQQCIDCMYRVQSGQTAVYCVNLCISNLKCNVASYLSHCTHSHIWTKYVTSCFPLSLDSWVLIFFFLLNSAKSERNFKAQPARTLGHLGCLKHENLKELEYAFKGIRFRCDMHVYWNNKVLMIITRK